MRDVRAGKPLRQIELRSKLFSRVLELKRQNLSYSRIIDEIQKEYGVRLSKSHISTWLAGKHTPTGSARDFNAAPSPELAYVIGVKMGDASQSLNRNYSHKVKLLATDKDFVEEFARCLSIVLKRTIPPVHWYQTRQAWYSETSSVLLRHFLIQPFDALKPSVEHSDVCASAFLKGFIDSEGSINEKGLRIFNTNRELLSYTRSLLWTHFHIESTGPHLRKKAGGLVKIKGSFYHINKNQYYVYIRATSLQTFKDRVGFTIARKRLALEAQFGGKKHCLKVGL